MVRAKDAKVVAVGGIDPSGHSGVLADGKVFQYHNIDYRVVLTAVTAQSEKKFYGWEEVEVPFFKKSLNGIGDSVDGIKIGMLASQEHLRVLMRWFRIISPKYLLWDPVFSSSTGGKLFRGKLTPTIFLKLIEMIHGFTPNLLEAEFFLGRKINNLSEMETAARELYSLGKAPSRFVLLKGGHLSKKQAPKIVTDILVFQNRLIHLSHPRMENRRGTGCTLGSAILSHLVKGVSPIEAVGRGKKYLLTKHLNAPTL